MNRLLFCVRKTAFLPLAALMLIPGCSTQEDAFSPDHRFTPYITAFTAGHISAREPILVRIAEDQRWKDTATIAIDGLFDLSPKVEGTVQWLDRHTLVFRPAQRLDQEKTYTVRFHLGELIAVPAGLETFKFQVSTIRQGIEARVSDMQSLSPTDLTWQRLIIAVRTGDDATGQDIEGCFSATQDDRSLPLTWEHGPDGRNHIFTVDSVRRGEHASIVNIAWNGERIGSGDTGSLPFTIPAIGELTLISATTTSEGDQHATLLFSDPLDADQDISGLVGIAGGVEVRLAMDANKLVIYPSERLSGPQQAYVDAAVRNVNDRPLGHDLNVDLLFEELKPAIRMVGKGSILPSSNGLVMPFEAVNLNAVVVRVVKIHESNVAQFLQVNALDGRRELARVGRLITRKTVALKTVDAPDLGRWNRFYLDLEEHIEAEPGAIYRVELSFTPQHITYPCPDQAAKTPPEPEATWEEEQARYDNLQDYWYYDEYDHWDGGDQETMDPCSPTYFAGRSPVTRNILASDLGLIAKGGNDGSLLIAVSDLRSTEPMPGVKLEVLDLQRKTVGQVVTDRNGLARLPAGTRQPSLVIASKGRQRGYLPLGDGRSLSVSEFDVKGEAIDRGLKGFLYGERGVWRPGDSLYLAFMLQDTEGKLPKDHPVVLELTDPQGRLDQKYVRTSPVDGIYPFRCATTPDAPTGLWSASVVVGGTSFHRSIRIETVKPNRLKIDLGVGERLAGPGQRTVRLHAHWLHGSAARGLGARVTMTMSAAKADHKGFEKYHFDDLRTTVPEEEQVTFDGRLDDRGETSFPLHLDAGRTAPSMVRTNFVTRIFEAGGDASMDRTTVDFYPYASYAGIKPPGSFNAWGGLSTDTTYSLPVVALSAEGRPLPGHALKGQVYKMKQNWWWDGDLDGMANYISSPSVELVQQVDLVTDANGRTTMKFRVDRPEWGQFTVRVTDPSSGHSSALQFHMDWPGWEGRSRRDQPDHAAMLTFNSDKSTYHVGEQATLIIPGAGTGRALVSLENGSRTLDATWIDLEGTETRHTFTISADMAPNIYAHVMVVQPHERTLNDLPIRLYGMVPIQVEDPATHLQPVITMPREVKTDDAFTVEVSEQAGEAMSYTLAIVDEGLLDLTRFKTPDPWKHFHAREALGVRTWDVYDHVIGAFGRQLSRVLALGGSDDAAPAEDARANRFKPVVRYVGPFALDRGRKARHSFTISNYVGSVRVMVVATNGRNAYGHAEKTVPVKKPLMLLATLPRVLAPGEQVELPVTVFAMDPGVKEVNVKLEPNSYLIPEGPATRTIRFNTPGEQVVRFRARVKEATGIAKVKIAASGGGEHANAAIELDVRQPNPPATEVVDAYLEPGESWRQTPAPIGLAGTNSAYLEVSTIQPVDLNRRLRYLMEYPHGCLEQTASRAFPQMYMAKVMNMPARSELAMRSNVEAGLRRLVQFQRSNGGFNNWPGGGDQYDEWTSIYAGHFMIEAQREGFVPAGNSLQNWLSFQRGAAREWHGVVPGGWSREATQLTQAYRLYTLALAKQPELAAMNRLREQRDLAVIARWMLAAAYACAGQKDAAGRCIEGIPEAAGAYDQQGCTYGSELRDAAIIAVALMQLGEVGRASGVVQRITRDLGSDGWHSTQGTAFGLMAVARFTAQERLQKGISYQLTVNGRSTDTFTEKAIGRIDLPNPDDRSTVSLTNTGKSGIHVRYVRMGTPLAGDEAAASSGLSMSVEYTTVDGRPIDPARIEQGTDLAAVVTIVHPGTAAGHLQLALTQVFPSGWEIRNNRLEGSHDAAAASPFTYQDMRDDRVMTYFHLGQGRAATCRILLNAAYTGRFYLPGATCEAMYDHTVNARSMGRWVEVVRAGGADSAAR